MLCGAGAVARCDASCGAWLPVQVAVVGCWTCAGASNRLVAERRSAATSQAPGQPQQPLLRNHNFAHNCNSRTLLSLKQYKKGAKMAGFSDETAKQQAFPCITLPTSRVK